MPGFHPLLGLLAVAVCISFARGAPLLYVLKHDGSANRLHESYPNNRLVLAKHDNEESGGLYKNNNQMSLTEDKRRQDTDVLQRKNAVNMNESSGFEQLKSLRRAIDNDFRGEAVSKESNSRAIDDPSGGKSGLISNEGTSGPEDSNSSSEEDSEENNGGGQSGDASLASVLSNSQEDCDENGENENRTKSAPTTTTSTQSADLQTHTEATTKLDETSSEECEESQPPTEKTEPSTEAPEPTAESPEPSTGASEPPSVSSSSSQSNSQETEETEECTEGEDTTSTRAPTTKTRTPRDPNKSSGSFWESDEEGVQFSDSQSEESKGDSTNLSRER